MTIEKIEEAIQRVERRNNAVKAAQRELAQIVAAFFSSRPESVREIARKFGFSAPYISDIINGRRGLSSAVLKKLRELE